MPRSSHPLYKEFFRWEQLGRGELTWNQAVQPEPLFHPFFAHGVFQNKPPEIITDDGLIASPLSRLNSKLQSFLSKKSTSPPPLPHDPLAALESRDAPDYCHDYRDELVEFVLLVPDNQKISPASFEYFLYALTPARFPLCFEIIATHEALNIQLTVDASDQVLVADCLESYLPEIGVEIRQSTLPDLILERKDGFIISRELALEREFIFPIRTGKSFAIDPYQAILSAISNLSHEELAVVQINFQPCSNPWAESVWRLVTDHDESSPFFENGGNFLSAAQDKNKKPYMATTLRIAALAPKEEESRYIARRLAAAFQIYEDKNSFVLADDDNANSTQRKVELAMRHFRRSGMLLNTDEFQALVHLPDSQVNAPKLLRLRERTYPAPLNLTNAPSDSSGLVLGENKHKSQTCPVILSDSDRSRHMHVIGASGTGKSTFLLNSIIQDLENGHGCALLDPHGDLVDAVLDRIPEHRIKDVILFNPADEEYPVGFNILSAHSEIEKNLLSSDFVSIFQRLSASWGDNMSAVLGNATLAMLENENGGTLLDLRRFLVEPAFRMQFLEGVSDEEVRYFWLYEFPLIKGNTQSSLVIRLNMFLRQKLIRNMVAQKGDKLNFGSIMDEGKIFLAPLSQGLIGEENSWLLGSMLVSKFYQTALSRQDQDEKNRRPYWLYIDEAHNFLTPSIASILSGTRKYRLGLILAHQELAQFGTRDTAVLSSILTNAHTRVCFRLGDQDARKLEEGFSHFDSESLRTLEIGQAICRVGGGDKDFNIKTPLPNTPQDDSQEKRQRTINQSRATYGTPREEVEAYLKKNAPHPPPPKTRKTARKASSNISQLQTKQEHKPEISPVEAPPPKTAIKNRPATNPSIPPPTLSAPEPSSAVIIPYSSDAVMPPATYHKAKDSGKTSKNTSGRGGAIHKSMQQIIKRHANGLGLRADIEAELPNQGGAVDILIQSESKSIAIEVALHSPIEQEIKNIQKSLDAGIEEIIVVSDNQTHLENIRKRADENSVPLNTVTFLHNDAVGDYFANLVPQTPTGGMIVQGYKVETTHASLTDEEKESRDNNINKMISEHIQQISNVDEDEE